MPNVSLPPAIAESLVRLGRGGSRVVPLTPDASDRRYYRVNDTDGSSLVLALHAAPFLPGSLPSTIVGAVFEAVPLPVARIQGEFADLGVLVLDDLGDVTLQACVEGAPGRSYRAHYERAVDHLVRLQRRGAELAAPGLLPYTLAFDVEKLMWEMDFFLTHFVERFRGRVITASVRSVLHEELLAITQELADEPRVLCHRDYHSRNLMVVGDELFVIDFQDARLGPSTYDLVSLLRDSYVDLPPELVEQLMARFRTAVCADEDAAHFSSRFDLMGVQRNLKALGTFGYQAVERANPLFAQYVPRTAAYVRATFDRRKRFDRLRDVLAPLVPEVA